MCLDASRKYILKKKASKSTYNLKQGAGNLSFDMGIPLNHQSIKFRQIHIWINIS
jgi:hypothetical protein